MYPIYEYLQVTGDINADEELIKWPAVICREVVIIDVNLVEL